MSHDPIATLAQLIAGIDFAMLTTVDADGTLHSRPMAAQQIDFDGDLWFFTGRSTHKIEEIRARPQVSVSFSDPHRSRYVTIAGNAEIVDDGRKAQKLWRPAYKAWFPLGLGDPDLVLLKVRVDSADCWSSPESPRRILGLLNAVLASSGRPHTARHEHLDLRR